MTGWFRKPIEKPEDLKGVKMRIPGLAGRVYKELGVDAMLLAPGVRRAIVARTGQGALADPVPLLRRITAPTLLVWGEKDAMIPVANAADYQSALPDSRLVVFPGLGHVPHEEAPALSLEPVRAFLGGERAA